jgi:hypothetical protein
LSQIKPQPASQGSEASRHLDVVALEILHAPSHVEREIKHPLLVIAVRAHSRLFPDLTVMRRKLILRIS